MNFPFPLVSFPSCHFSGNGIHQGLQKTVVAKEAEVTPNSTPLVAAEAEEEQSHSFRSYKINQGLSDQPEEPFISTPGTQVTKTILMRTQTRTAKPHCIINKELFCTMIIGVFLLNIVLCSLNCSPNELNAFIIQSLTAWL